MNEKLSFRQMHQRGAAFVIPNPWDTGTARILAALGFEALATTSAGHAFSLGRCDGAVDRDTVLEHCRDIVNATDLPVSADLENGFGDSPEVVAETIVAAAGTGLAGCSIEDYSGDADHPIYAMPMAVDRIRAAVDAKNSLTADFVLTARCENFLRGHIDLDDTIRRLQAYDEAGADVLYAPGLKDLETIKTVCQSVDKPVNVLMGSAGATFGVDEIAAAGARRISVGSALARSAFGQFITAASEIAEKGTFRFADTAAEFSAIEAFFSQQKES